MADVGTPSSVRPHERRHRSSPDPLIILLPASSSPFLCTLHRVTLGKGENCGNVGKILAASSSDMCWPTGGVKIFLCLICEKWSNKNHQPWSWSQFAGLYDHVFYLWFVTSNSTDQYHSSLSNHLMETTIHSLLLFTFFLVNFLKVLLPTEVETRQLRCLRVFHWARVRLLFFLISYTTGTDDNIKNRCI